MVVVLLAIISQSRNYSSLESMEGGKSNLDKDSDHAGTQRGYQTDRQTEQTEGRHPYRPGAIRLPICFAEDRHHPLAGLLARSTRHLQKVTYLLSCPSVTPSPSPFISSLSIPSHPILSPVPPSTASPASIRRYHWPSLPPSRPCNRLLVLLLLLLVGTFFFAGVATASSST